MTIADLNAKWSHYCDINTLVTTTMNLLQKYGHRCTEHGVCCMLDTYFTNKADLINLFKTSEHYIGNMRIAFDIELEREHNPIQISNWCEHFLRSVEARPHLVKMVDEEGKKIDDYLTTGISRLSLKDLMDDALREKLSSPNGKRKQFSTRGEWIQSIDEFNRLDNFIAFEFGRHTCATLSSRMAEKTKDCHIPVKLVPGMKTSRAMNKVCAHYGIDKLPKYNKLFAEYADMVSDLKRKLKFFISLNPLDYLTMSFGVNWSSCQTIDRSNIRQMPNSYSGQYCNGVLSYMLDSTSMITYVHNDIPENIEEGKIYRNMFHYKNELLIQGRIYPQGNDGATDLYSIFRGFVQQEMSKMLGMKNEWKQKPYRCGDYTSSIGNHYRDYTHFNDCNISCPTERTCTDNIISIGHHGVCPVCGTTMHAGSSNPRRLCCDNCY